MGISTEIVGASDDATGIARAMIRPTFNEIESALGNRLSEMQQRVSGIMANASSSGGINDVVGYTDTALTEGEKAGIFGALGDAAVGDRAMAYVTVGDWG